MYLQAIKLQNQQNRPALQYNVQHVVLNDSRVTLKGGHITTHKWDFRNDYGALPGSTGYRFCKAILLHCANYTYQPKIQITKCNATTYTAWACARQKEQDNGHSLLTCMNHRELYDIDSNYMRPNPHLHRLSAAAQGNKTKHNITRPHNLVLRAYNLNPSSV